MIFALTVASAVSHGSATKGFAMVAAGILLGMVGIDIGTGRQRFTFGIVELADGLSIVAIAMGLFGVAEILHNLIHRTSFTPVAAGRISIRSLLPKRADLRASAAPAARGTLIGAACGILPGTGATLASFLSYAVETRVASDPSRFGKGAIEGVAAPEAANNAAVQAAFIPTLILGVPGDAVMALLLGAIVTHGVVPGPWILANDPALFWGLVASFWVGNLVLLVLNLPLIGIWVRILSIPYHRLYPLVLLLIGIGVYGIRSSPFDVFVVIVFGIVGYGMKRLDYPPAPLLFGFVLGPLVEDHLRRALLLGHGNLRALVASPVSAGFLLAALAAGVWASGRRIRRPAKHV
jgi:TctA family transporter